MRASLLVMAILLLGLAPASGARTAVAHPVPTTRLVFAATVAGPTQIYSAEPSGRGIAQLTFGATSSASPLPSPNGRRVLFSRQLSLWVMMPDGRGQRRLVAQGREAAWAPDSYRIAYVAFNPQSRPLGIRLINVDGSGDRLLVHGSASSLAWSPDGRSLAFARGGSLCILRNHMQQTIVRGPENAPLERIAWSPDGRWIAYVSSSAQRPSQIVLVHPNGAHRRIVGAGYAAAWSPEGSLLAYAGTDALLVLNVRSGVRHFLGSDVSSASTAALVWSPRGGEVAYLNRRGQPMAVRLSGLPRPLPLPIPYPLADDSFAWTSVPRGLRFRSPLPLTVVSRGELRERAPISELTADGDRVAFGFCFSLGLWTPESRSVVDLQDEGLPLCTESYASLYSVALAGDRVAWGVRTGGCCPDTSVLMASLSTGKSTTVAYSGRTRGPDRDRTGWVLGAGDTLVFSSRKICEDYPPPTGPTCAVLDPSQRPVLSQTIWRIREPSWQGSCPYADESSIPAFRPGPCEEFASEPGPFVPNDVDGGRVVAIGDNAVVVLDENSTPLLELPLKALAAQLSGSELIVLLQGELRDYEAASGALLHAWPLPDLPSGGVCRADCGEPPRLQLEDAARGLVAYLLDGQIHLLRLADGRDVVLHKGTAARFGGTGLFYAYEAPYPWRGRIRFVPFDQLTLH